MKIDNIIFDFNGTIIDDVDLCISILNYMLETKHHPLVTKDQYLHFFRFPIIEYYRAAGFTDEELSDSGYSKLAQLFIELYQPSSLKCSLYKGFKPTVERYKDKKNLYLLSATEKSNLYQQTNYFKITQDFKEIIGQSDVFAVSKVDVAKSFADRSQIDASKTVIIGDTDHDYEVAASLGAHSILIKGGHQAKDVLMKTKADYVADKMEDIWKFIE